jgi:hypothetical protein
MVIDSDTLRSSYFRAGNVWMVTRGKVTKKTLGDEPSQAIAVALANSGVYFQVLTCCTSGFDNGV